MMEEDLSIKHGPDRERFDVLAEKTRNLSLLIVEDEEILLKTYKTFMGRYFEKIEIARDGQEGLETYKRMQPDIVITDIVMPNMDGLEMAAEIRKMNADVQIIISTAYMDTKMMQRAIESGIDHYVTKPIRVKFFLSIIEKSVNEILRVRDAHAEIRRLTELLTAIKTINELIVKLSDGETLLKTICGELVKRDLYANVWIARVDEEGNLLWSHAEGAGSEKIMGAIDDAKNELNLRCIKTVNNGEANFKVIKNKEKQCSVCDVLPFENENNGLIFSLKFQNKIYGYMNISMRDAVHESSDEFDLLLDVANDVAYALHKYELEEQGRKNEKLMLHQSRLAAMGEMISMIAHQWRQPITTIGMSANNMILEAEMDQINKEEFSEHLHAILDQVRYLSQTIDDFRNFFDPNRERQRVRMEKVIDEVSKIISKSLESSNIRLLTSLKGDGEICIYENELVQVLLNIIKNAKDELITVESDEKEIKMDVTVDDDNVQIRIEDSGNGIPEGDLLKIFEPYYSTKGVNGTGLGLYMSGVIITKHFHGSIHAENGARGAVFTITFPKEAEDSSAP
jgi:signal transduction histidine kinase/DNA-binding NarL/FixJ family response regulator